jgi:tape measure domain-containing protein
METVTPPESLVDGPTLGRLERWRKARAVFVRPDGTEAEQAVSRALGRVWARGQVYGRARRLVLERSAEALLTQLAKGVGALAGQVRVAPEDPSQTKWDAVGNLTPLSDASRRVAALWLVDVLRSGELFVEFQPIFELSSGAILGAEGLLRAAAPTGRCASRPTSFRPAAQRRRESGRPDPARAWRMQTTCLARSRSDTGVPERQPSALSRRGS